MTMNNFPGRFRVFDVLSDEFVLECHLYELPNDEIPDLSESRYELSWLTGWSDACGENLWGGDVVKRFKDQSAERQRIEYQKHGTPVDAPAEDLIDDYSGAVAVIEWKDGGFAFDQLFGHKWAFYGPEGGLDARFDEIKKLGSIHQKDINSIIDEHEES